nr:hypothetical protein [Tanacetum cinerariifolium]
MHKSKDFHAFRSSLYVPAFELVPPHEFLRGFPIFLLNIVNFNRVFDAFFLLESENSNSSFQCLCGYCGMADALNLLSARTIFSLSPSLWNTPFSNLLNTIFLSGPFSLGDLERPCLGSGLLDILQACLDPSLSLRLLLLFGVPNSECREVSSKLRRAFTALSFSRCTFSWCTFSALIGRI